MSATGFPVAAADLATYLRQNYRRDESPRGWETLGSRAVLACAARCVRRVQPILGMENGDDRGCHGAVERALRLAELVAAGHEVPSRTFIGVMQEMRCLEDPDPSATTSVMIAAWLTARAACRDRDDRRAIATDAMTRAGVALIKVDATGVLSDLLGGLHAIDVLCLSRSGRWTADPPVDLRESGPLGPWWPDAIKTEPWHREGEVRGRAAIGPQWQRGDDWRPLTDDAAARVDALLALDMPWLRLEYPDMWVAYGPAGLMFPPEKDKWALLEKCKASGARPGEYSFASTAPEPTEFEVTETQV